MANHTATKKSIRKIKKRTLINKSYISEVRTAIKKVEAAIVSKKIDEAKGLLRIAQSKIMKAVNKKLFKINSASRKISRLSVKIKKTA